MSHEQSITVEMDGKHYNLPTVYNGKKVSNDDAVRLFKEGKIKHLGVYDAQDKAGAGAKERSKNADPQSLLRDMWDLISGGKK